MIYVVVIPILFYFGTISMVESQLFSRRRIRLKLSKVRGQGIWATLIEWTGFFWRRLGQSSECSVGRAGFEWMRPHQVLCLSWFVQVPWPSSVVRRTQPAHCTTSTMASPHLRRWTLGRTQWSLV